MKKKILVVEDEIIIAENLRLMLNEMNGYEVTGIACNLAEAKELFQKTQPELVLLDIRLGDDNEDGILFSKILSEQDVVYIFITAHGDADTVKKAIAGNPAGYLIKPVNRPSLFAAVELAFSKPRVKRYFVFKDGTHDVRVEKSTIVYLKSDNIYTELHTTNGRYLIRSSTKNVLEQVDMNLVQVHRSFYVNPAFASEANAVITLSTGEKLPLSRTYRQAVLEEMFRNKSQQ